MQARVGRLFWVMFNFFVHMNRWQPMWGAKCRGGWFFMWGVFYYSI